MGKIAIIYGSTTDNTKAIAETIASKLSGNDVSVLDVSKLKAGDLDTYPNLILGTSTWGLGDLQDDWDGYLSDLKASDLSGKTIAFFGVGDSSSYPDTFVDGMGILYQAVQGKGATTIGAFPTDGYSYDESQSVVDGKFVGVALDEDNESDQTEERLNAWIESIKPLFS
ncbi:flavodoxin [Bacteroidales bacterium OttesenSCG-928-A17]|nr:flavodoxin [Bacteroidales bacterium OttesenSCG-928-A17]